MEKFSKIELADELKCALVGFAENLEAVLYPNAASILLCLDQAIADGNYKRYLAGDYLDINRFKLFKTMDAMFDYAIEARCDINLRWESEGNDAYLFLRAVSQFNHFDAVHEIAVPRALHVAKLANARFRLDDQEDEVVSIPMTDGEVYSGLLSLSEVALLAGMDEKSVRNAANPNNANRLLTFNNGCGTYVNTADARVWLAGRRGFKPTHYVDTSVDRDLVRTGFKSTADLGRYLQGQREKAQLTLAEAIAAAGLRPELQADLHDLEKNAGLYFDEEFFLRLGRVYKLDIDAFVQAAYGLYEQHKRAEFERDLALLKQQIMHT
jgi:hypothetical protein